MSRRNRPGTRGELSTGACTKCATEVLWSRSPDGSPLALQPIPTRDGHLVLVTLEASQRDAEQHCAVEVGVNPHWPHATRYTAHRCPAMACDRCAGAGWLEVNGDNVPPVKSVCPACAGTGQGTP